MRRGRHTRRRLAKGFTLLEVAFTIVILSVVTGAILRVVGSMNDLTSAGSTQVELQRMGEKALERILNDLRRSGYTPPNAGEDVPEYPYFFVDGSVDDPDFDIHEHPPAVKAAEASEYDFGPNREIVFRMPADLDFDGTPDVDANGELAWSIHEISYVVVTRADGVNYLERRTNGAAPQRICSHVERIVFEGPWQNDEVPLRAVRVRIFFRKPDGGGTVHRWFAEALVNLKNSFIDA
jgi:prepilin-type N-terminal cleavage/methylation domain-containing protein